MKHGDERKLFGGFNFIIVLWVLITIFRLSVSLQNYPIQDILTFDLFTYIIPILFLAVLNVFVGITQFTPHKKNNIWLLSLIIATATLMTLSSFQTKLDAYGQSRSAQESVTEF